MQSHIQIKGPFETVFHQRIAQLSNFRYDFFSVSGPKHRAANKIIASLIHLDFGRRPLLAKVSENRKHKRNTVPAVGDTHLSIHTYPSSNIMTHPFMNLGSRKSHSKANKVKWTRTAFSANLHRNAKEKNYSKVSFEKRILWFTYLKTWELVLNLKQKL